MNLKKKFVLGAVSAALIASMGVESNLDSCLACCLSLGVATYLLAASIPAFFAT